MWESGLGPAILIVMLFTWIGVANEKSVHEANMGAIGCLLLAAFFYFVAIDLGFLLLSIFLG